MKIKQNYLSHHGIRGQKWGVKNGPPYPLKGGSYDNDLKKKRYIKRRFDPNNIYNKKHFDTTLDSKKTTLRTLSYDENRTKNVDMFYATHTRLDKAEYQALFNKKIPMDVTDEKGNKIGTGMCFKKKIDNNIKHDMKVASEDSGAEAFKKLFSTNRDFYNFVTDSNRMESYFVKDKYKFRGYRESKKVLDKMKDPSYTPTSSDLTKVYRMFNYCIPYDGNGNASNGNDVKVQRTKFFNECKSRGYGAVLDTNDAIYGGFKAKSPVIVFDMDNVVPDKVKKTKMSDKAVSKAALVARKTMGI